MEGSGDFTTQLEPLLHEQPPNPALEKNTQRSDLDSQIDSEECIRPSQVIPAKSKRKAPATSKRGAVTGATGPVPERSSTKEKGRQPQARTCCYGR